MLLSFEGISAKLHVEMNVYQFDEALKSVKEKGAQTSNSELSKTAFPQKQAEDLEG